MRSLRSLLQSLGLAEQEPVPARPASPIASGQTQSVSGGFPPGPVPGSRLLPPYVRAIGHLAYLWAWPLVNIYNRHRTLKLIRTKTLLIGGVAPVSPINHLAMLHDYVDPGQRYITCPSQDLIYGYGVLDLGRDAVIVQVPDFGDRFFVFQATDQRTDAFTEIGSMYGTEPGFYLLAGPGWRGATPAAVKAVFRSSTDIGTIIPRVFQADDRADNAALQPALQQVMAYPLAEFDGTMKTKDWSSITTFPWVKLTNEEWRWVTPKSFFDRLPDVLDVCPPLPGEEALYALFRSVLGAANDDRSLRNALYEAAEEADEVLVKPLLEFRNFGVPLPHNWTTVTNSAAFGTDYYTRTAVAKSNIFINRPRETRYFYQDLDSSGGRLNGSSRYTVTFKEVPPVEGYWSITLYDKYHFFASNDIDRFSLGTKSKELRFEPDGSLVVYVQRDRPDDDKVSNWLPAPGDKFSLYIRAYWPRAPIMDGKWTPPPVVVR